MATENINAIYDLEKWVGFYEQVIKRYSNIDPSYIHGKHLKKHTLQASILSFYFSGDIQKIRMGKQLRLVLVNGTFLILQLMEFCITVQRSI